MKLTYEEKEEGWGQTELLVEFKVFLRYFKLKSRFLTSLEPGPCATDVLMGEDVQCPHIRSPIEVDKSSIKREESWSNLL